MSEILRKTPEGLKPKEYGQNIKQRDFYFRHGEKAGKELAPEGFKQAEEIGEAIEPARDARKHYFSDLKRTEDFIRTVINKVNERATSEKKFKGRLRTELSFKDAFPPEFMKIWKESQAQKGVDKNMQWYLDFGSEKPVTNAISPEELASRVAKQVLTHYQMTDRYRNGSEVDLFNGSHSPVLETFLKEAIGEQIEKNPINPEGKTFIEKMAGACKTAEGFEIDTIIDNEGNKTVKLVFRNKEFDLDINQLQNLIEKYEKEKIPENPITVYYLRHGESSEDKNDPLRGLTEKGVNQVTEAIRRITQEIADKDAQIRLYSSGSERTRQQCIVAAKVLKEAGFTNINIDENSLPEKRVEFAPGGINFTSILEGEEKEKFQRELVENLGLKVKGPGIAKRIAELRASKEYKAKLRQLEKETGIGAVVHWLMDKDIPADAETGEQKAKFIEEAIDITQKWSNRMKRRASKPIVALVFGHASALTAYGAKTFKIEPDKLGEIENAEGIKINFSGLEEKKPDILPFGEEMEKKVKGD